MASIYHLNNPTPFPWDYLLSALENHPFFAPQGHHDHHHGPRRQHHPPPFWPWGAPSQSEGANSGPEASQTTSQNADPTPGPSTGEKANASESESDNDQRRPRKHGKDKRKNCAHAHGLGEGGRGGKGRHGGPGARPFAHGHHHHHHPYAGPHGPSPFGPFGYPHPHPFGGPHHRGGRGRRGMHHGPPPPFGAGPRLPDFEFLRGLASQFGLPFSNAPAADGVDFVPPVDVFDTPANYFVHVSLPGAKKDDLSIDYDPEESALRLAGVVYRPGISEDLHQALAMGERAREVGVFEREVRLGTREAPAPVIVEEVTAKLEDGILVVTLPKIVTESEPKKRVVVEDGNEINEKDTMHVDERVNDTPSESEESESEEDARDYVKIPVN